jgi:prevent-host-death family protein
VSKSLSNEATLKTISISEARAHLSKLVKRALTGEPQRVTRYGKEAVIIVSEAEWLARSRAAPTLGALLASFAVSGSWTSATLTACPCSTRVEILMRST